MRDAIQLWWDSINRNIVECKYAILCIKSLQRLVLIETLWNVNSVPAVAIGLLLTVLIETLWNVNHIEPVYIVRYAPAY